MVILSFLEFWKITICTQKPIEGHQKLPERAKNWSKSGQKLVLFFWRFIGDVVGFWDPRGGQKSDIFDFPGWLRGKRSDRAQIPGQIFWKNGPLAILGSKKNRILKPGLSVKSAIFFVAKWTPPILCFFLYHAVKKSVIFRGCPSLAHVFLAPLPFHEIIVFFMRGAGVNFDDFWSFLWNRNFQK